MEARGDCRITPLRFYLLDATFDVGYAPKLNPHKIISSLLNLNLSIIIYKSSQIDSWVISAIFDLPYPV